MHLVGMRDGIVTPLARGDGPATSGASTHRPPDGPGDMPGPLPRPPPSAPLGIVSGSSSPYALSSQEVIEAEMLHPFGLADVGNLPLA